MENLQSFGLATIIGLLARHTENYSPILKNGGDKLEFESSKIMIKQLQLEIKFRKETFQDNTTTISLPDNKLQNFVLTFCSPGAMHSI